MSVSLRENITAVIETCFSETKDEIQDTAINRILELIRNDKADRKTEQNVVMPKKCKGCDSASKIIEAYSRGYTDGADAVKKIAEQTEPKGETDEDRR